ncbi:glycosyltransferase, exosortase A system-associated [Marinobacterium aestuarii]|uniref:Glycosyltransferase, exosortase A system-associated n=1 Tax=Marinobacterium aestuarii TaxID=1821621 RepID=A0A1A9EX82_9GAMM|nr:TIGR04063 family PEP-CTERM/XrtA system glycosyltransferase [Marinobacterium aestuarii]ANG62485.1 glycosyltransferase, exosortase A system-associated [Marinobacterium aestuarii]
MKILHIFDHSIPLHSGYTFRSRAILENQRVQGLQTCHLTSPKQGSAAASKEQVEGLDFYRCKDVPGWIKAVPFVSQLAIIPVLSRRIAEVIDRERPDIIHAHSPALNGIAALQAARKAGLPLVYEVRAFWEDAAVNLGTSSEGGMRYRLTRALETHVLKRADAVTCICQGLRQDIIARGVPAQRITTIPNAVDLEQFPLLTGKSAEILQLHGLIDQPVIGFIGSFYEYEGLDILIQAVDQLRATLPNLRVLLVGGGPQETFLKQLACDLGVNDRIIFTGRVPHQQVASYYSVLDALVYPRKSMRLTELVTPLKPMEAMAQGKPVLASDVGGHRELITHGENGYLFAANNPAALANAIESMFRNTASYDKLVVRGREFVEQERNWVASVGRYPPIYAALAGTCQTDGV